MTKSTVLARAALKSSPSAPPPSVDRRSRILRASAGITKICAAGENFKSAGWRREDSEVCASAFGSASTGRTAGRMMGRAGEKGEPSPNSVGHGAPPALWSRRRGPSLAHTLPYSPNATKARALSNLVAWFTTNPSVPGACRSTRRLAKTNGVGLCGINR